MPAVVRATLLTVLAALLLAVPAAAEPVQLGKSLYGAHCLSCHGGNAAGTPRAPSLRGVGARAADFYLRTGYMPLPHLGLQPRRSHVFFSDTQIRALVAYIASLGTGPPIPAPQPQRGSLSAGQHLFTTHCAGCHQVVAQGGVVAGAVPPPLEDATDVQIAEAVRIGPYVMPSFSKKAISDRQLDSIIRYVAWTKHPDDRGGWAIGDVGPVPEGLVTWFIAGAVLIALCLVIGKRLHRA
jgi:ubiquinol-cytochrome c reductase cytochrome c subunit